MSVRLKQLAQTWDSHIALSLEFTSCNVISLSWDGPGHRTLRGTTCRNCQWTRHIPAKSTVSNRTVQKVHRPADSAAVCKEYSSRHVHNLNNNYMLCMTMACEESVIMSVSTLWVCLSRTCSQGPVWSWLGLHNTSWVVSTSCHPLGRGRSELEGSEG